MASAKPCNTRQDGYNTLLNASIGYCQSEHFDLALVGNHLTDKRFSESYNNRSKYATSVNGDTRNVALRATLRY